MMSHRHHPRPASLLVAALVVLAGCSRAAEQRSGEEPSAAPAAAAWDVTIQPLTIPAAASTYPQLTTSERGVILSWIEDETGTATLKFAEYTGSGWSPARTIASSDNWFLSAADVPMVLRMSDGTLVTTTYPAVDPSIEAYDLRLSYSRDEGKTWSRPITPHHDGTKTQHGFATLFERPDGGLGLVWLDGRRGDMSLYYGAFDKDWKQTAETAIDTRACECCQTSVALTAEGPLVAFRDRSPREIRDIYASLFTGGEWTQPRPVNVDNWRIEACPVNGPAVSARDRQAVVAWFTVNDDRGQAYAAFSQDAGRTWGEPIRLDEGISQGHVDVELLADGSAVASWIEYVDERSQFRIRRIEPSGARSTAVVVSDGKTSGRVSGYPRLTRHGSDLILAWTESRAAEGGGVAVRAAVARLE